MTSDLLILKALLTRKRWRSLSGAVPVETLSTTGRSLFQWINAYWNQAAETIEVLDCSALEAFIKLKANATPEQLALTAQILKQLNKPVQQEVMDSIIASLLERDFSGRAGALIARFNEGAEIDLVYELSNLSQAVKRQISNSSVEDFIDTDIGILLSEQADDHGLKLPTMLLSTHIKGLLGGDLVAIAARPDKGKSSLLAAICTHLAPQIPKCFDADRPILWLNNEGSGKQIVPRVYQAALKVDGDVLQQYNAEGTLVDRYTKAVGHKHRIRVKDMHGASFAQIEQVIEAMNPCVVLFDMVANFRGGLGGGSSGGNKTDEIESKWQAMREMAVQHDFIAFGTIQVSADGDDMLYPPYGALKDSKTSVQGAVDILLMLGALNSPDMQSVRGLSTPKNKRQLPKMPSYVQGQVHFDAAKCQFLDGE